MLKFFKSSKVKKNLIEQQHTVKEPEVKAPEITYEVSQASIAEVFSDILRSANQDKARVHYIIRQLRPDQNDTWNTMLNSLSQSLYQTFDFRFASLENDINATPTFLTLSPYLKELKYIAKEVKSTLLILQSHFNETEYNVLAPWYRRLYYTYSHSFFLRLAPFTSILCEKSALKIIKAAQKIENKGGNELCLSFLEPVQVYITHYCNQVNDRMLQWIARLIQQELNEKVDTCFVRGYLTSSLAQILSNMLNELMKLAQSTGCNLLEATVQQQCQAAVRLFYEKYANTIEMDQVKLLGPERDFDYLVLQLGNCTTGFKVLPDWVGVKQSILNLADLIRDTLVSLIMEDTKEALEHIGTEQWLVDEQYLRYITDTFDDYMNDIELPTEEVAIFARLFFFRLIEAYQHHIKAKRPISERHIVDYLFLLSYFEKYLENEFMKECLTFMFDEQFEQICLSNSGASLNR